MPSLGELGIYRNYLVALHIGIHSLACTPMRLLNIVPVLAVGLLTGCATVITGTNQAVTIDSNVQGANVSIEGNQVGVTPFSGKIPRKRESIAVVSKPGYTSQPITLTTSFNPLTIISICCWDLGTTDCITGACWEYSPNSYYVNLRPAGTSLQQFQRDTQLKAFAMTYYGDFVAELAAGSGPKIEAFRAAFFAEHGKAEFVKALRDIEEASAGNAVAFGEKVAAIGSR